MTTQWSTPSALGRRLQRVRVGHWFAGNQGDPYALILRALRDDPSPYEEEVRARGPVFHSEVPDTWVIADGALARSVLTDARFGAPTRAGGRHRTGLFPPAGAELAPDRARDEHSGVPAGAGPAVSAQDEAAVEALAEQAARTLLGGLGAGFDLVTDFARRLPARVLAEFLGVPEADHDRFEELLTGCARSLDSRLCPQTLDITRAGLAAAAGLQELLERHLGDGGERSARAALTLAVGVAEPSSVLICNAFETLGSAHGQWDALCRNPESAAAVVEETWWRRPPVRVESRIAREDVELAGVPVPADGHVAILVAAAQRDPAIAPARAEDGTVGAPLGLLGDAHATSAARTAGAISRAALRVLAREAPDLRPSGAAVRLRRAPVTLGHARFPVARTGTGSGAPTDPAAA
ncbi:P450-derived glycosyltransferase activator [Streptomyces sp. UNOB3_S3]|uniref:cytochrome P450 family protein n=1 Tax=Streptomyces sp. UNOB3_S3 TaxID=2871682 RepID=UPI001E61D6E0|nr:P450-derived glycosyltransferase activator [Streptomyces sp. UNOB3_S3]MCC3777135.1 P450-derived glycosyltransferase activator [Streptomyces sp. UNOB3_S3]